MLPLQRAHCAMTGWPILLTAELSLGRPRLQALTLGNSQDRFGPSYRSPGTVDVRGFSPDGKLGLVGLLRCNRLDLVVCRPAQSLNSFNQWRDTQQALDRSCRQATPRLRSRP